MVVMMFKTGKKYIVLIVVLFAAFVLYQFYAPKPVKWVETYGLKHKMPYGCYVINDMLKVFFDDSLANNNISFYENKRINENVAMNLVIITNEFYPDETDIKAMLKAIKNGSTALIAASEISNKLLDTLHVEQHWATPKFDSTVFRLGGQDLNFYNPILAKDSAYSFSNVGSSYFSFKDEFNGSLLAYNDIGHVHFASVPFGKGKILLHSLPKVFTNYHILYGHSDYVLKSLSYLPHNYTIFDEYYKPFKVHHNSPTEFLLANSPLRIAFYISLTLILLYLVFGSRRRQRFIPIVEKPHNSSKEFILTVGRLYYKSGNHANIAKKMSLHFKEFLREKYGLNTVNNDDKTIKLISLKTGVDLTTTKKLINKVMYFSSQSNITAEGLKVYNSDIQEFVKRSL